MHLTSHPPLWIFTIKMRPNIFLPHNVDDKEPIKNFFLDFFIVGGHAFIVVAAYSLGSSQSLSPLDNDDHWRLRCR